MLSQERPPGPGGTFPEVLAGRYRLEVQIGAGGAGTVWRAADTALGRQVAVKLLHPELERDPDTVARFRREATAAAKLTHPNAVVIYDIGEEGGRVYLVMELVDGPTLDDLLAAGPLGADAVGAVGLQMARALGDAHARGLVHRDIKPANVLLTVDGTAKVADFGIAKALGEAQTRLTVPGTVVGTAAYLAPEQLRGDGKVDARADVYALGLLLHECLTGQPPFGEGTAVEVATRRLTGDPPAPRDVRPDVPGDLDAVIRRATRHEVDERFADGTAMAATLEDLVSTDAVAALAGLVAATGVTGAGPVATHDSHAGTTTATPSKSGTTGIIDPDQTTAVPSARAASAAPAAPPDNMPVGVPGPPAAPPNGAPRGVGDGDERQRRPMTAIVAGVGGVALVAALIALGQEPPTQTPATDPGDDQAAAGGQEDGQEPGVVEIVGAEDYDPFGDDGQEHADEVALAFDGDPGSGWTTSGYNSADLGGLKDGVGIWFDLGEVREVAQVELALTAAGGDLAIYAREDAPDVGAGLDGWGDPAATLEGAEAESRVEIDDARGRYWLVWFTSLPSDGGRHRGGIAEITFTAP